MWNRWSRGRCLTDRANLRGMWPIYHHYLRRRARAMFYHQRFVITKKLNMNCIAVFCRHFLDTICWCDLELYSTVWWYLLVLICTLYVNWYGRRQKKVPHRAPLNIRLALLTDSGEVCPYTFTVPPTMYLSKVHVLNVFHNPCGFAIHYHYMYEHP